MKQRSYLALALATMSSLSLASVSSLAWSQDLTELHELQSDWAKINYSTAEDQKEAAFTQLINDAQSLLQHHPEQTEYRVWLGIIQSSTAGAKGGLGALSLAKEAKANFEQAIEQDPKVLQGSAYTSLGVLYHKVPGWPIGFGSDKKAKELLEASLKLNPNGIDSNYFYAEYLYDTQDYKAAQKYLTLAQNAAPRPDRASADEGRQKEISVLMNKLEKALKSEK